ncbi:MAG: hypothetical protein ABFS86_20135, partial [Planctomycetota bacterium]
IPLAIGAVVAGLVVTVILHASLARAAREGPARVAAPLVLFGILALFPLSMQWPGEILMAQEGLTVYGIVPVPALDIVVGADGWLRFREKTHELSKAEVDRLVGELLPTDTVVIGTGWDEQMKVDPLIHMLPCDSVLIVRTPEAFDLYNKLRREGKRVVLIAHTTC